jgi:hypothetical protein
MPYFRPGAVDRNGFRYGHGSIGMDHYSAVKDSNAFRGRAESRSLGDDQAADKQKQGHNNFASVHIPQHGLISRKTDLRDLPVLGCCYFKVFHRLKPKSFGDEVAGKRADEDVEIARRAVVIAPG